ASWGEGFFDQYRFPFVVSGTTPMINLENGTLNPDYLSNISLPEVLWSLPQGDSNNFDLSESLSNIYQELILNPTNQRHQKIMILSNQPPKNFRNAEFIIDLHAQLATFSDLAVAGMKISFYYLVINNQATPTDYEWQEILLDIYPPKIRIQSWIASEQESLEIFVNNIIHDQQQAVLLQ
ncbi:MAG: hypothetical protein WD512_03850, partial [Candidatus Paceibacterota bacterium]